MPHKFTELECHSILKGFRIDYNGSGKNARSFLENVAGNVADISYFFSLDDSKVKIEDINTLCRAIVRKANAPAGYCLPQSLDQVEPIVKLKIVLKSIVTLKKKFSTGKDFLWDEIEFHEHLISNLIEREIKDLKEASLELEKQEVLDKYRILRIVSSFHNLMNYVGFSDVINKAYLQSDSVRKAMLTSGTVLSYVDEGKVEAMNLMRAVQSPCHKSGSGAVGDHCSIAAEECRKFLTKFLDLVNSSEKTDLNLKEGVYFDFNLNLHFTLPC